MELFIGENQVGKFYLPHNDIISNEIASGKLFDAHVVEVIQEHSGKVALDVGANIGQMTVCMAQRFERVYAFEANPNIATVLKQNLELNNIKNVTVIEKAVWNVSGKKLPFHFPDGTYGSLGSYGVRLDKPESVEVESLCIDDLNIDNVDFMKFDIQGADLRGMQGAEQTIARCKPTIIFEYESLLVGQFGEGMHDYDNFISSIGYTKTRQLASDYILEPKI